MFAEKERPFLTTLPRKAKIVCQNFCLDLSLRGSKDLILQNDKKYDSKGFLHSSKSKFDGTCFLFFCFFLYLLPGTRCAKKEKKTSLIFNTCFLEQDVLARLPYQALPRTPDQSQRARADIEKVCWCLNLCIK